MTKWLGKKWDCYSAFSASVGINRIRILRTQEVINPTSFSNDEKISGVISGEDCRKKLDFILEEVTRWWKRGNLLRSWSPKRKGLGEMWLSHLPLLPGRGQCWDWEEKGTASVGPDSGWERASPIKRLVSKTNPYSPVGLHIKTAWPFFRDFEVGKSLSIWSHWVRCIV